MPHLNRRDVLKIGASTAAACALAGSIAARGQSRRLPNILLIISQDQPASTIGAYGGPLAALNPTPTIDRLASQSIVFTNAHARKSCTKPGADRLSLAARMHAAGYQTAMIGHWAMRREPAAFDFYQLLSAGSSAIDPTFHARGALPWGQNTICQHGHATDGITDLALDWLAKRDDPRPFFLVCHDNALHDLFGFAPRYEGYLAKVTVPEPVPPQKAAQTNTAPLDRAYQQQAYQACCKAQLRCLKGIDDNLARLFAVLEVSRMWNETMIIFTSEQGSQRAGDDSMPARWLGQAQSQVPLIVRAPGGSPARRDHKAIADSSAFVVSLIAAAGRPAAST